MIGDSSPRDDGEHRVVQPPQAGGDIALLDERAALKWRADGREVRVAEALADRGGLGGRGMRGLELAVVQLLLRDRHQQVAPLDAVRVLDEPLAPRDPGVRLTDITAKQEVRPSQNAQRAARARVVRLEHGRDGDVRGPGETRVAAGQVRGGRQPLEIVRVERRRLIGAQERLVGVTPRARRP